MHGTPVHNSSDTHFPYANPEAPKGGHIKMHATGTFDTLNPFSLKGQAAEGLHLVHDRLMAQSWDEPFTLYPLIAEAVSVPEDRSRITFYLNPKARFHDGAPITSEDVLFSWETLKEFGRPNHRNIYKQAARPQTPDAHTVTFYFKDGYSRETALIFAKMPILSKAWWSRHDFNSTILTPPTGSGPYTIKSVDPGRSISYERIKDYWAQDLLVNRGHYNFETMTYTYFRDDGVALEAFLSGALDFRREPHLGKWYSAYDKMPDSIKKVELPHGRAAQIRGFIFNTRRPPFDDINVRQALNLAFNFSWVNKNLFYNAYRQVGSFFPNTDLAASGPPSQAELALLEPWKDELPPRVFQTAWDPVENTDRRQHRSNLRKANRLLEQSGWIIQNGKRVHEETGAPFKFELLLNNPEDEKIALSFAQDLEKLGIYPDLRVLDSAAFRGRLNTYDFDMVSYFWFSTLSPGTEQWQYWSCDSATREARWNFAGICLKSVDMLAKNIADTIDYTDMKAHAGALDRILGAHHLMIPLYFSPTDRLAYKDTLSYSSNTPLYGSVLETWWYSQQKD